MDSFYSKLKSFVDIFSINICNEYNNNRNLVESVDKYKEIYNKNRIINILTKIDNYLIKKADNLYNLYMKNKFEKIKNSTVTNNYNFENIRTNKNVINYKNSLTNKFLGIYYKFIDWFSAKDKFYIKNVLIKNLKNTKNYTEEGFEDLKLVKNIENIFDIRNIENTGNLNFSFRMSLFDPNLLVITNKFCNIKVHKEDEKLKINEIICEDIK